MERVQDYSISVPYLILLVFLGFFFQLSSKQSALDWLLLWLQAVFRCDASSALEEEN